MLPTIPKEQRNRVAHFLEKQSYKQQALAVSCDPEHRYEQHSFITPCMLHITALLYRREFRNIPMFRFRFELAIQLGELKIAYDIALEDQV